MEEMRLYIRMPLSFSAKQSVSRHISMVFYTAIREHQLIKADHVNVSHLLCHHPGLQWQTMWPSVCSSEVELLLCETLQLVRMLSLWHEEGDMDGKEQAGWRKGV